MSDNKKKRALAYSFSTMLILVGVLLLIVIGNTFKNELLGLVAFFICLIPAVGMFVYLGCTEEEKEAVYAKKSKRNSAISSSIWLFCTAAFFVIGFVFDGFAYAWVCFLIGAALDSLVELFSTPK